MKYTRVDHDRAPADEKPLLEAAYEHYGLDFNPERAIGMACCPFHEDGTPSFSYNLNRQLWKCHSCGAGGDVYEFIIRYETVVNQKEITFVGAKSLAASLGLAARDDGGSNGELSGSSYAGSRTVSARPRNRPRSGGYTPAWRRR
ncbi:MULTISPECIES: CHC2 zinc finger domain-containing protein [Streptomyces]|uniref:CHC2 zinc finger domain-containing protein n=1 Tax=Streptomyces TaxID=1883 RepID=UPI002E2ABD50|nr:MULTISPECIES: CHC2 zinc finger domain-containing protein [Streptomyces]